MTDEKKPFWRAIDELGNALARYDSIIDSHTRANAKERAKIAAAQKAIDANDRHLAPYLAEREDLARARERLIAAQMGMEGGD